MGYLSVRVFRDGKLSGGETVQISTGWWRRDVLFTARTAPSGKAVLNHREYAGKVAIGVGENQKVFTLRVPRADPDAPVDVHFRDGRVIVDA